MDQIMSALVFLIAHDRNPGAKWGGGLVIESMDLFIALWLDTETLIVTDDHDTRSAAQCYRPDRPSHEVKDALEEIARLVVYEQMAAVDKAAGNVARTRERSEVLVELLTAFNSCVDSYGKGCRELYHYLSDKMFEQLARFSERFCESTPEEETEGHHLARIGHQTMAILYNVMVNQHPFSHPKNQGYVNGIAQAVSALDKIWRPYPYLRFLALLTGACAAKDQRTKAFFHTRLARALRALEYSAWPDVKYFVIYFRQFRSVIEPRPAKPGRRRKSSPEVSNDEANKGRASPRKGSLPPVDKLLENGNLMWNGTSYGHGPQEVLYDSSTFQQAVLHGLYWRTEAQATGVW
ncbi:hypothetical protein PRZ48_011265 [Zasmidium cellare]|uniref:Uncharacterized protein n=1 Tax=Zasmidium cellare TaxID=395010 RepID=A0ABR0EBG7_ZASCE|nr:hypothetical protein PRZ48_011265 [Zasmidium cellare]